MLRALRIRNRKRKTRKIARIRALHRERYGGQKDPAQVRSEGKFRHSAARSEGKFRDSGACEAAAAAADIGATPKGSVRPVVPLPGAV